jgi:hypothetical protein
VATTAQTVIPVELTKGINDFTVTIVGPGGESDPSLVVRYVLDQAPAKITIYSPEEGAVVNGTVVEISGKTQARSSLIAQCRERSSTRRKRAPTVHLTLGISTDERDHDHRHRSAGNARDMVLTVGVVGATAVSVRPLTDCSWLRCRRT